jgi:hypothetical protein
LVVGTKIKDSPVGTENLEDPIGTKIQDSPTKTKNLETPTITKNSYHRD